MRHLLGCERRRAGEGDGIGFKAICNDQDVRQNTGAKLQTRMAVRAAMRAGCGWRSSGALQRRRATACCSGSTCSALTSTRCPTTAPSPRNPSSGDARSRTVSRHVHSAHTCYILATHLLFCHNTSIRCFHSTSACLESTHSAALPNLWWMSPSIVQGSSMDKGHYLWVDLEEDTTA